MPRLSLADFDYAQCPKCGGPTSWVRGGRQADRVAYRRRSCADPSCGQAVIVAVVVLTGNPMLAEALGWYHDRVRGVDPLEAVAA